MISKRRLGWLAAAAVTVTAAASWGSAWYHGRFAGPPSIRSHNEGPTAQQLLAAADAAERDGNPEEAVRLYRVLQSHHPQSTEAATSRVILGKLLLSKFHHIDSALAQFDAYLSEDPRGSMIEEALVGKASSLEILHRSGLHLNDDEREVWQQLVDRYPTSVHAERARARLRELDRPGQP